MPFPDEVDDFTQPGTTHGDVSAALEAVEAHLADGGRLLSGTTAPVSGSGLLPLDGVNDPWRWFQGMEGWVGPAYEVTWSEADLTGTLPVLPAQNEEYALWIGSVTTPTEANQNSPGQFGASSAGVPIEPPDPVSNIFRGRSPTNGEGQVTNSPGVAIADGSGIAFLFQMERNITGPTAVPDPSWGDLADLDAMLGDVVRGAPFTFNEAGDGVDGDFWLNTTTLDLYGPKTDGVWPAGVNIRAVDLNAYQFIRAPWYFFPDNPADPPITIRTGTETADGDLSPGNLALWYEDTEAAPVVHFKGKDAAGTVYVLDLPMSLP